MSQENINTLNKIYDAFNGRNYALMLEFSIRRLNGGRRTTRPLQTKALITAWMRCAKKF